LTSTPRPGVPDLAREIVDVAGGSVRAVVLYGSHLSGAAPDRHSAVDFLVLVDSYAEFYHALTRAGRLRRRPWTMRMLSHVLPPNVTSFTSSRTPFIAKCLVVDRDHFHRAMGEGAKDHFLICRMRQWVEIVYAASPEERAGIDEAVTEARRRSVEWIAPYLATPVDALGLAQCMLEVCYKGEVRPESRSRASTVLRAQAHFLRKAYGQVLEEAVQNGVMEHSSRGYILAEPVPPKIARYWHRRFQISRLRASARWAKHVITFDNWFGYLIRKVERHSGTKIVLTPLESCLPLLFIWPKAIAFVRTQYGDRKAERPHDAA